MLRIPLKLWFKIALPAALTSFLCIEVVTRFLLTESLEQTKIEVQKNLTTIAGGASLFVSAEDHRLALSTDTSDTLRSHKAYERIRQGMMSMKKRIQFSDDWYSLLPNHGDTSWVGVSTNPTYSPRTPHLFRDTTIRNAFENTIHHATTTVTDIYTDDFGQWLTAFAPIVDSSGSVVAALEVSMSYNTYFEKESTLRAEAKFAQMVGLIASCLLGIVVGYTIAKPVKVVNEAVENIIHNDFQGMVTVPRIVQYFPDETSNLSMNFNQMSVKLRETIRSLRLANLRLSTLDEAKSVFLKFVAHELRTPLIALNSLYIVTKLQKLEPDTMEILENGIQGAERLKRFTFAAEEYIQALIYKPVTDEPINCIEVMGYILSDYHDRIEAADCTLSYTPAVPEAMIAVPYEIVESIILPLLDNTIKFMPSGGKVTIEVGVEDDTVFCAITDSGVGFTPEIAEEIFEPFYVAQIQQHSEGSAVSLAKARVLARHYNGDIRAYSEGDGKGSTFTVLLPMVQAPLRMETETQFYSS